MGLALSPKGVLHPQGGAGDGLLSFQELGHRNGPGVRAGALHVLPLLLGSLEKAKSTVYGSTACDCLGKTRLRPEGKKE